MVDDKTIGPLYVALIHFPVVNKQSDIIGSAVTNLDLHDIARASRTFGVRKYFVVTPYEEQKEFVAEILSHWITGSGGKANPDRGEALSLIRISHDLEEAVQNIEFESGKKPILICTCARQQANTVSYQHLRDELSAGNPVLLLFGTAWGLAPELMEKTDGTLPPINGSGSYNHLSVRSAVSIVLSRLCYASSEQDAM